MEQESRPDTNRHSGNDAHRHTHQIPDFLRILSSIAGFLDFFGGWPLKRAIQAQIGNPLAKAILEGRFAVKDTIRATFPAGVMRFENG